MRPIDFVRLITLAAIWGGSFIFMRVLAPALGPFLTADLRVSIAGIVLLVYFLLTGFDLEWKQFWKHYLIIGVMNSGIPFVLYSFAALHIPASYSVILNSTAPLFGAVFSSLWLGERLNPNKIFGLFIGALGVSLVAKIGPVAMSSKTGLAIVACLGAAICYGLTGVYIKKFAVGVQPKAIAGASQFMAGVALLPLALNSHPTFELTPLLVFNVLALAVICSAIAYLLYYRLVADIGPTQALTVTFLMPVFGILWGSLILGEKVTRGMVFGCMLIVLGTVLVLNVLKRPRRIARIGF